MNILGFEIEPGARSECAHPSLECNELVMREAVIPLLIAAAAVFVLWRVWLRIKPKEFAINECRRCGAVVFSADRLERGLCPECHAFCIVDTWNKFGSRKSFCRRCGVWCGTDYCRECSMKKLDGTDE